MTRSQIVPAVAKQKKHHAFGKEDCRLLLESNSNSRSKQNKNELREGRYDAGSRAPCH